MGDALPYIGHPKAAKWTQPEKYLRGRKRMHTWMRYRMGFRPRGRNATQASVRSPPALLSWIFDRR